MAASYYSIEAVVAVVVARGCLIDVACECESGTGKRVDAVGDTPNDRINLRCTRETRIHVLVEIVEGDAWRREIITGLRRGNGIVAAGINSKGIVARAGRHNRRSL